MTTIFLDLEETLIESWDIPDWLPDNAEAIKTFIQSLHGPAQFGIMSWAIWNERDREAFIKKLMCPIEDGLGIEFQNSLILTMEDWAQLVLSQSGLRVAYDEVAHFGKETILFWLRHAKDFPKGEIFLIDDTVEHNDCIISLEKTRKITMKNVKKMVAINSQDC